MQAIGYITVTALAIVYGQTLNGWTLCVLWEWFIVPTFGCVGLSIPAAIGISLVVSYLTTTTKTQREKEQRPFGEMLLEGIITSTIKTVLALMFGYVVQYFM